MKLMTTLRYLSTILEVMRSISGGSCTCGCIAERGGLTTSWDTSSSWLESSGATELSLVWFDLSLDPFFDLTL